MFLHNTFHLSSFRILTRSVFAFGRRAVIALCAALLFVSCQLDPGEELNTGFIPAGEWSDGYGSGYKITSAALEYYTASSAYEGVTYPAINLKGTIETANDFSSNAGVLLIKITEADNIGLTVGKYTCVYYREYTSDHVLLANPVDALYNPIEVDTLGLAESTFTVDAVDTHVTFWGSGYTK
jgi:hypothetical protein